MLTYDERVALMRRLQLLVSAILYQRTGGRTGGKRAEIEELAAECGCHTMTMYRYLGGVGPFSQNKGGKGLMSRVLYLPRFDVLVRLAQVSTASMDWIAFGKGAPPACVRVYQASVPREQVA